MYRLTQNMVQRALWVKMKSISQQSFKENTWMIASYHLEERLGSIKLV